MSISQSISPCTLSNPPFRGRVLSNEFMQLPSKKEWPIYYKDIKKPQCFDAIFVSSLRFPSLLHLSSFPQKHIKRKEYHTAATFAADVELVFSNALQFNQEHTQIWDDAMTLRVCLCFQVQRPALDQTDVFIYRTISAN